MGKAWWSKTGAETGKPKFSAKPVIVTRDLQVIERPTIIAACEARGIALTVPPTAKRREEKKLSLARLAELVGIEGEYFQSKREGSRYVQLKLAEKGGVVRNLQRQPEFKLHVVNPAGLKVCITEYHADFEYDELLQRDMRAVALFEEPAGEQHVVEECKGFATKDWELRRKWVETEYGITIRVT